MATPGGVSMGAGAVKGQQQGQTEQQNSGIRASPIVNGTQADPSRCKPGSATTDGSNMVCEACNANFTLFKRKVSNALKLESCFRAPLKEQSCPFH